MSHVRVLLPILLAACGSTAAITGPGASRLEAQAATARGLRIVVLDARDVVGALLVVHESFVTSAVALPGGDWLIGWHNALARLSPDGRIVRWTRELEIRAAIAAGDLVVATDASGVLGLHGDGSIAWKVAAPTAEFGQLLRVGGITVIAGDAGELAVDDAGKVLWTHEDRRDYALAEEVGTGVLVVTSAHTSLEYSAAPRREPMIARVLDPRTGGERARLAVVPEGDSFALSALARAGRHVVVRAHDVRALQGGSAESHAEVVVLAVAPDALSLADTFAEPAPEPLAQLPTPGRDEAVFVTRSSSEPLAVDLIDVATRRTRHSALLHPLRSTPSGEGAYMRVLAVTRSADQFTFSGQMAGAIEIGGRMIRAEAQCVDGGEGQRSCTPDPFIGSLAVR